MAIMRKRTNRKRAPRRRRFIRRRGPGRAPNVHVFKEMYKLGTLGSGAAAFTAGVLAPKGISELTNAGSVINMFDLYKITGAKFKIIPRYDTAEVGTGAVSSLPLIYLATNRDPFTPPAASVADILNDDTCRAYRLNRPISWYVKAPKPDMSSTFTIDGTLYTVPHNWQLGVSTKYQPWLTTGGGNQTLDQSALAHYGLRWGVDNSNNFPVDADVYCTLYFQCKEQN